jgi:hypothetical protein
VVANIEYSEDGGEKWYGDNTDHRGRNRVQVQIANSRKLPPSVRFILPGAVFHGEEQPESAIHIPCGKLRSTRDTRVPAGGPYFDSSEGWNLLIPKQRLSFSRRREPLYPLWSVLPTSPSLTSQSIKKPDYP